MVTTGNPVRKEIAEILNPKWRYDQRAAAQAPLNILIVGGSLGAQALNERVPAVLKQFDMPLKVFHQCGQKQLELTQSAYQGAPASLQVEVQPFITDMAKAYSDADLIICRAGALTVTEVATAGVAAIFVPLPIAVDDHQTANARFLADLGAAKICQQAVMSPEYLKELLAPLLNRQLLTEMAVKARQQAQPNATQHVVDLIKNCNIEFIMSPSIPAEQVKELIKIPEMRRIKQIHFVGIGGAGMCGIAEVLKIRVTAFQAQILRPRRPQLSSKKMVLKYLLAMRLIILKVPVYW